jgi:hypothetical protein
MKQFTMLMFMLLQCICLQAAITIRIEASFGAKKKDCRSGLGICSAKAVPADGAAARTVMLTLSDDETFLTMTISRSALEEAVGQVTAGRFVQEEDFTLPAEVSMALGLAGAISIPAGDYEARPGPEYVMVRIPIAYNPLDNR